MTITSSKVRKPKSPLCADHFAKVAKPTRSLGDHQRKPKGTISLRVSEAERAGLEKSAAGIPLSAYVRERLFGKDVTPRRTRGKHPVKDYEALGRVLALLGRSGTPIQLNAALDQIEGGKIIVSTELDDELREACFAIASIRQELIKALGLSADRKQ